MISFLRGTVAEALPQCLVVDVNGVGYEVTVPLSTFDQLNPMVGQGIMLKIHMHVRENAQVLYGFATDAERDIFRLLIDRVSGIGPATAIAILSSLNVNTFKQAVVQGDVQSVARAKGVGKRTAERYGGFRRCHGRNHGGRIPGPVGRISKKYTAPVS